MPPKRAASTPFSTLLRELNIEKYADALADEEVHSAEDLKQLTAEDIKEIGLKIGARNRVLKWAAEAKEAAEEKHASGNGPPPSPAARDSPGVDSIFASLDKDGDGQIDASELGSMVPGASAVVSYLDKNGDGKISKAELAAGMSMLTMAGLHFGAPGTLQKMVPQQIQDMLPPQVKSLLTAAGGATASGTLLCTGARTLYCAVLCCQC